MLSAYAQAAQSCPTQPNPIVSFIPFILIFGIFYFLLIRPQQKQQQELKKMIESVGKNDEIITTGGIHGTILNVKDTTVVLRIDDNVKVELSKSAIAIVKKKRNSE